MKSLFKFDVYRRGEKVEEVFDLNDLPEEIESFLYVPHDGCIQATRELFQDVLSEPFKLDEVCLEKYMQYERDSGSSEIAASAAKKISLDSSKPVVVGYFLAARSFLDANRTTFDKEDEGWSAFVRNVFTEEMKQSVLSLLHSAHERVIEFDVDMRSLLSNRGTPLIHVHTMNPFKYDEVFGARGAEFVKKTVSSYEISFMKGQSGFGQRYICVMRNVVSYDQFSAPFLNRVNDAGFDVVFDDPFSFSEAVIKRTFVGRTLGQGFPVICFDVPKHIIAKEASVYLSTPWVHDIDSEKVDKIGGALAVTLAHVR